MEVLTALLNTVLVAFVVATMLSAGLRTSVPALLGVLRNAVLVVLVLITNLVVVPLLGLAVGLLSALSSASLVALVLVASSPGAPFGAKLAMIQKGDVVTGSVLQVLLTAVGSLCRSPWGSPSEPGLPPRRRPGCLRPPVPPTSPSPVCSSSACSAAGPRSST